MYFLGVARAANVDKLSFLHALNRQTRRVFGIKTNLEHRYSCYDIKDAILML